MSIKALQHQLGALRQKMAAQLDQRSPKPELADAFKWDLFTLPEQERLIAFLGQMQPKMRLQRGTKGRWFPSMRDWTIEEKDQLESWIHLHEALDSEEITTANRTRAYLALSEQNKEQALAAFMALDERALPDVEYCSEAPTMQWEGHSCRIYRRALQDAKGHMERQKERGDYFRRWEINDMWKWMEACQSPEKVR